jgi:hypothetical protein
MHDNTNHMYYNGNLMGLIMDQHKGCCVVLRCALFRLVFTRIHLAMQLQALNIDTGVCLDTDHHPTNQD